MEQFPSTTENTQQITTLTESFQTTLTSTYTSLQETINELEMDNILSGVTITPTTAADMLKNVKIPEIQTSSSAENFPPCGKAVTVTSLLNMLLDKITQMVDSYIDSVLEYLDEMVTKYITGLPTLKEQIMETYIGLKNAAKSGIPSNLPKPVVKQIKSAFDKVWAAIKNVLTMLDNLGKTIQEQYYSTMEQIKSIQEKARCLSKMFTEISIM